MHKNRIKVCNTCDQYTKFKVCKACKCFMPLKARLNRASCPKGKWEKQYDGSNRINYYDSNSGKYRSGFNANAKRRRLDRKTLQICRFTSLKHRQGKTIMPAGKGTYGKVRGRPKKRGKGKKRGKKKQS